MSPVVFCSTDVFSQDGEGLTHPPLPLIGSPWDIYLQPWIRKSFLLCFFKAMVDGGAPQKLFKAAQYCKSINQLIHYLSSINFLNFEQLSRLSLLKGSEPDQQIQWVPTNQRRRRAAQSFVILGRKTWFSCACDRRRKNSIGFCCFSADTTKFKYTKTSSSRPPSP